MPLPKPTGQKFENLLLKPADLEGDTQTLTVKRVGPPPQTLAKFHDMAVYVDFKGVEYVLPLATDKQNYLLLHEAFGDDDKNWIGKTFRVREEWSSANESAFVKVMPFRAGSASSGRKRSK